MMGSTGWGTKDKSGLWASSQNGEHQSKKHFWLGLGAAFLVPFVVYLPTVYPTYCFFSDSGDFVTAGELLMLPHPTGYPWFSMLGKLFATLLPVGEVVWRYGLLTMLFVPLSATVAYLLMVELTSHVSISMAAAWSMAFGATLWYSAVAAEVYSSNLFLTLLALYALVRFWKTGERRWFYTAGLTVGFGAAHHLTLPLMVVGGLVGWVVAIVLGRTFLSFRIPNLPAFRDVVVAFLVACLPLAYYAYLPIRAPKPYGYRLWQLTGDDPSKSFRDFVRYVLGLRFRYMMGTVPLSQRPQRFVEWLREGMWEYAFLFGLGFFFGWLSLFPRFFSRLPSATLIAPFWLVTLGMWVAHMAFYLGYAVPDIIYFFVPAWTVVVLWGGLTAFLLWEWGHRCHGILAMAVLLFAFLSAELTLFQGWKVAWQPEKERGRRYLETVLRETPRNSALLVSIDDVLFHLWAIQAIENKRLDVLVVSVYQWEPILPFLRPVASTTADVYRFFNPYPWHLHPISPYIAVFDKRAPIDLLGGCKAHQGIAPFVHETKLWLPLEGVHIGTLLAAKVRLCVDAEEVGNWGYLWLIRRTNAPITDANGPNSSCWAWWWFYQPLLPLERQGRVVLQLTVGLPFVGNTIPGSYEVRGLVYLRTGLLPTTASQMQALWAQATFIGIVNGWGR